MTDPAIQAALDRFTRRVNTLEGTRWDADDSMTSDEIRGVPPGALLAVLHERDPEAVRWLTYHVCRWTLPCWERDVDDGRMREVVERVGQLLRDGGELDRRTVETAARLRARAISISTGCAADAIDHCVGFLTDDDLRFAICCVSDADVAYEHDDWSLHDFRAWFRKVAISAALEKREPTEAEFDSHRPSV